MFLPPVVMALWALVYLGLLGAIGAVTGAVISWCFRRRPSKSDALVNAAVAATLGILVMIIAPAYYKTRGQPWPGGLSLWPVAVTSGIVRQLLAIKTRQGDAS